MKATVGDWLVMKGHTIGQSEHRGRPTSDPDIASRQLSPVSAAAAGEGND